VTGAKSPSANAPLSIADPRPWSTDRAKYQTGGHFGVVRWDDVAGSVTAAGRHDNAPANVADPRVPSQNALPSDGAKGVFIIRSADNTWHRPFTTLEVAALQSLVDPEDLPVRSYANADSRAREWIGNAVPPDAAAAVASTMGETLLLARQGETFMLSNRAIWVDPLRIGLTVPDTEFLDDVP
jgi:site-specific DNA-cytosine methylase